MTEPGTIQLPSLGYHLSVWGSGHTHSGPLHEGPCVCECGLVQPDDARPRELTGDD